MSYYERKLPHWQPEGTALFVTWRLCGSLPRVVEILKPESAGKGFAAMDQALDKAATGRRWLKDERVAQSVLDALRYGERQLRLYELQAWVIMVNHVHVLINPKASLSRITKTVKGYSARRANRLLGRTGQPFWQDESYDHWLRSRDELAKIVRYIESNPLKAGLVERIEEYRWSSAFQMTGLEACPTCSQTP